MSKPDPEPIKEQIDALADPKANVSLEEAIDFYEDIAYHCSTAAAACREDARGR